MLLLLLQLFSDAFSRESQLLACDPRSASCLATALMMRGRLSLSDAQRNIARLRPTLRMAHWNTEVGGGWQAACRVVQLWCNCTFAVFLQLYLLHQLHRQYLCHLDRGHAQEHDLGWGCVDESR
jgi:hypothetical protein